GVNDDYRTLRELLYGLERICVKPYYLFQCEDVMGTDHFRVDVRDGMRLMEKLWKTTSGICLPRYVADMPGTKGKVPLQPASFL
ncbi:MAG: lysine 2,3-aminomutase, partial [Syntrophales bacterium]|nr:lysine 2,3-aminomutase [Syntrophales bacterium]